MWMESAVEWQSESTIDAKKKQQSQMQLPSLKSSLYYSVAESKGFEPLVVVTLRRFSKPLPSATRPTLLLRLQKYKKSFSLQPLFFCIFAALLLTIES